VMANPGSLRVACPPYSAVRERKQTLAQRFEVRAWDTSGILD